MSPKKASATTKKAPEKATKKAAQKSEAPTRLQDKYRAHEEDTGSTEVQIAGLSERIDSLANHLKDHAKDHDSRRGLLLMVGKRRRLLNYLKKENIQSYQKLIADLGLRK